MVRDDPPAAGRASEPAWKLDPPRQALLFLKDNQLLVALNLTTGTERVVAGPWLPNLQCPALGQTELRLQTESDLVLGADGRYVCLALYDRNPNMASFMVSVRADLVTRETELSFPVGCDQVERTRSLGCNTRKPERSKPESFAFAYDDYSRTLRDASQRIVLTLPGWDLAEKSPRGRFIVLRGNFEEGDYIHFNLLVVDRRTGAVLPLPNADSKEPPAWPQPLTPAELADPSRQRLGPRAGDYVGESQLRFASETLLAAGELLFFFEHERVSALPGDLAH